MTLKYYHLISTKKINKEPFIIYADVERIIEKTKRARTENN